MSLKNSLAGLPHGGGKAVLIGDPQHKSRDQLLAYGDLIESLGGKYVTAGDVGMQVADMDTVGERSQWVTGRSPDRGGVGDSGILTAVGIWQGMRAAANFAYGSPSLADKLVAVVGAGKVGGRLIDHLIIEEGARVVAMDPNPQIRTDISAIHPDVEFVESLDDMLQRAPDVLSPNAMGGFLTVDIAKSLPGHGVTVVCGGANNQLASSEVGDLLAESGILYAPDFLVNCGGVIQVAEELVGADVERARAKVMGVFDTAMLVFERASSEEITPVSAAETEAWARIRAA
jgi:valine dehydrogenase (NAD+)